MTPSARTYTGNILFFSGVNAIWRKGSTYYGFSTDDDVKALLWIVLADVAFLDMGVRIEILCDGYSLSVYIETEGIMMVRQVVEEIAHAAAHVEYHLGRGRGQHVRHVPAYLMRGEELSHLEFLLRLRVLVVVGKVGLPQVVQPADAGIAVVDAFRRYKVLAGVYGEKYLFVDLDPPIMRYLLGYDGIHGFICCLRLEMKTPRKDALRGVVKFFS